MATRKAPAKKPRARKPASRTKADAEPAAPEVDRLLEHGRAAREDAQALAGDVGDVVSTAAALARAQLERNPYGTLLAAAGIGYVLGGGLPTRILALGATLAMRQASTRALGEVIARMQDGMAAASPQGEP